MSYELAGPNGLTRREVLARAAKSFLGVSISATLLDRGFGGTLSAAEKTILRRSRAAARRRTSSSCGCAVR
ncbi:MAG: hypothetical protein QM811_05105 [Pirellulales bacterium]